MPSQCVDHQREPDMADTNGNFLPDCDMVNPAANRECGPLSNPAFGTVVVGRAMTRRPDRLGKTRVQLGNLGLASSTSSCPGVGERDVFRRPRQLLATDNVLIRQQITTRTGITAPVDALLPGGGGNRFAGSRCQAGQTCHEQPGDVREELRDQTEVYNGVDLTVNARLSRAH